MSVDIRTRLDVERPGPSFDPASFFRDQLPAAVVAAGDRLAPAVRWLAPVTLVVACEGDAWVLEVVDGRPVVRAAGAGDPPVALTVGRDQLRDLAVDLVTPMAWLGRGPAEARVPVRPLLDWWILVRAALDGTAPYAPGGELDREMGALAEAGELGRAFRPDDPPDEMRAFLERTGYLRVGSVFGGDEMAAVAADMEAAAPRYRPGDGRSWWATTTGGGERLVRMLGFDRVSPAVAALVGDDRLQRIGGVTGDGHCMGAYGDTSVEALVKPLDVVRGLSEVPWHKDCSFGRHSYDCCSLTVGVSVTDADAASGRLRVIPGSHRALLWPTFVRPGTGLPVLDLPTRAGDVTVHLSCTLHMSQPPVTRERRVLYTSFGLPPREAEAAWAREARAAAPPEAAPAAVPQAPATP